MKFSNCETNNRCNQITDTKVIISNKKQISDDNIKKQFEEYILKKDFNKIENILLDTGEYDIQNESLETTTVNKENFLKWFIPLLREVEIESIETDNCLFCKIGNPVLIINRGTFPRKLKIHSEFEKTGLMLEFIDAKISGVTFCYTFLRNENKSMFQSNLDKIKKLEEQGISSKEAFKTILGFDQSDDPF